MRTFSFCTLLFLTWLPAARADWTFWRGPTQNGVAFPEAPIPSEWSPKTRNLPEGKNLVWEMPYGCRSTPLVHKGRVYLIGGVNEGKVDEQERVVCLDAQTGRLIWEHRFNVFLCDIVSSRVGWANLALDEETGNVYAHGVQGLFFCFSPDGKILWEKSLTEEFGRVTGYGGRVTTPIVVDDLVIINMLNSSWGDQGRGAHRSFGGADGGVHALQARTGKPVWSMALSPRGLNASPVVDVEKGWLYITNGEENLPSVVGQENRTKQGLVLCLDCNQVTDGKPKVVWMSVGIIAGYASPILHQGRLYVPDNSAKLYCLNANSGQELWSVKYGRVAKGSPVLAGDKIIVGEMYGFWHILKPSADKCEILHTVRMAKPGVPVLEVNGSPAFAGGRVFVTDVDHIYCIGSPAAGADSSPPDTGEKGGVSTRAVSQPADPSKAGKTLVTPAQLLVVPGDVTLHPGDSVQFKVLAYSEKGDPLGEIPCEHWTLPTAPPPPGSPAGNLPIPALEGLVTREGKLTVTKDRPAQSGVVEATISVAGKDLKAKARVRVAPVLPYAQDFEKIELNRIPTGWINLAGKFAVVELPDKTRALKKIATNPNSLVARANAFIGLADLRDYTITADIMGAEKVANNIRNLPDMGIINCRYSLALDGNKQKLFLRSWEARRRVDKTIDFPWSGNTWYRFKLMVTQEDGKAVARGKVWPKSMPEPQQWTIELDDPSPNRNGAPALYAFGTGIPPQDAQGNPTGVGAEIFFDNIKITHNQP
jgi:outer membrane protein assembly factor BamB